MTLITTRRLAGIAVLSAVTLATGTEAPLAALPSQVDEVPAPPEDDGPRHWTVTLAAGTLALREQPTTGAPVVRRFDAGTVLDNLGCARETDRVWCDVQPWGGGPRGMWRRSS